MYFFFVNLVSITISHSWAGNM